MSDDEKNEKNFMEEYGLKVAAGNVQVGESYPLYAIVTKILNESIDDFTVELNYSIEAHLSVKEQDKIDLIKERAFEPGIFVSTIVSTEPKLVVDTSTVIFGKRQNTTPQ